MEPDETRRPRELCSNGNRLRAQRAALIGLTYEEYVLEILERGRYLNASDTRHSTIGLMAFSPKFAPPERICLRPGS